MSTLRQKKPKPKKGKTPKKLKGKTTNTTTPPPLCPASPRPCHFLQRDFYYTLRFSLCFSSRLASLSLCLSLSYIYFACYAFPFIFTCIYRRTFLLPAHLFGICVGFRSFPPVPVVVFIFSLCFLFFMWVAAAFFLGFSGIGIGFGSGCGRELALTVHTLHL